AGCSDSKSSSVARDAHSGAGGVAGAEAVESAVAGNAGVSVEEVVPGIGGATGVAGTATAFAGAAGASLATAGAGPKANSELVYLINTGSASTALPDLLPGISVFKQNTNELVKTVTFSERKGVSVGHFASLSPDGSLLWLCNDLGNVTADKGEVDVYDTATLTIVKQFKGLGCGVQNTRSHDGKYVLTSSTLTSQINIFDALNLAWLGSIDVASAPHVGDTSPNDKVYYTTNGGLGHALAFDISKLPTTIPTIPLLDVEVGGNLHALRVHPNGKYLFVGASGTTGTNVIDLASKTIIAQVPGAPHNYAISPDAKYLASSELTLDAAKGTGERLQIIDISTLDTATPDPAKLKQVYALPHANLGGSHQSWSSVTGKLWYTLYGITDKKGQVWVLDTSMLPDMIMVEKKIPIGDAPHGVVYTDRND
ncbi:MAG TPA: hypothetical protein VIV60_01705, partial [Polyangiaceae bacterium]